MMLTLIAVGRAKRGPEVDLFLNYANRLRPPLSLIEVEEKRRLSGDELKLREADLITAKIPNGSFVVALDESGELLRSNEFAERLGQLRDAGERNITFIIGGADGLGASIRQKADLLVAFGPQTWPHMLVRAMLAEQLFRAQSILAGHPYHREG